MLGTLLEKTAIEAKGVMATLSCSKVLLSSTYTLEIQLYDFCNFVDVKKYKGLLAERPGTLVIAEKIANDNKRVLTECMRFTFTNVIFSRYFPCY